MQKGYSDISFDSISKLVHYPFEHKGKKKNGKILLT